LEPHERVLKAWLASRYSGQFDVEDVVQEAVVRVLKARQEQDLKSPKAYFFAIARNLAMDRARRVKVIFDEGIMRENSLDLIDETENIEETVARNNELEILTEAIQSLPERCRQAFTLCKVYGMTYSEVASEMGVSFNTVSTQISIGLAKITETMESEGRDYV